MNLLSWKTLILVALLINALLVEGKPIQSEHARVKRSRKHVISSAQSFQPQSSSFQPTYHAEMNAMDQQKLNKYYAHLLG